MVAAPFESLVLFACLLCLIYECARSICNVSYKAFCEIAVAGGELFVRHHAAWGAFCDEAQHESTAAGVEASERGKGRQGDSIMAYRTE